MRSVVMRTGAVLGLLTACAVGQDTQPNARISITVSKETTWATDAPLNEDGTVNYVAWINERFGEGVTPDNNAAVALLPLRKFQPAYWGMSGGRERSEACEALGVPAQKVARIRIVPLEQYVKTNAPADKQKPKDIPPDPKTVEMIKGMDIPPERKAEMIASLGITTSEAMEEAERNFRIAASRPWTDDEFPMIAGWLDANRHAIDLLRTAAKRDRYFVPRISQETPPQLVDCGVAAYRRIGGYPARHSPLRMAALRKAGTGDVDGALADVAAMRRLGRLFAQDPGMLNAWKAWRLHRDAYAAAAAMIPALNEKQTRSLLADVTEQIGQPAVEAELILLDARLTALDSAMILARKADESFEAAFGVKGLTQAQRDAIDFDWDAILRRLNELFNTLQAPATAASFAEQQEAAEKADEAINDILHEAGALKDAGGMKQLLAQLIRRTGVTPAQIKNELSDAIGLRLQSILLQHMPTDPRSQMQAWRRIALVACAATLYKADAGEYPGAVKALAPDYLSEAPEDPFSGDVLTYERRDDGIRIYSVGQNGMDDGGGKDDIVWSTE